MEKQIDFLVEKMKKGIVSFVYKKKNGEERTANGTLYGVEHTIKGTSKCKQCSWTLKYFDIDCNAWRSFIMDNLVFVKGFRQGTVEEHHQICLALVVRLKDRMEKEGNVAFAFRKVDGSVRYAHGRLSSNSIDDERYFVYFDIDKGEERKFRIDSFLGFGEKGDFEIDENFGISSFSEVEDNKYTDFSKIKIHSILEKHGISSDKIEDFLIIDLLPYLDKSQLKDLIIRATTRLAEL